MREPVTTPNLEPPLEPARTSASPGPRRALVDERYIALNHPEESSCAS